MTPEQCERSYLELLRSIAGTEQGARLTPKKQSRLARVMMLRNVGESDFQKWWQNRET